MGIVQNNSTEVTSYEENSKFYLNVSGRHRIKTGAARADSVSKASFNLAPFPVSVSAKILETGSSFGSGK